MMLVEWVGSRGVGGFFVGEGINDDGHNGSTNKKDNGNRYVNQNY